MEGRGKRERRGREEERKESEGARESMARAEAAQTPRGLGGTENRAPPLNGAGAWSLGKAVTGRTCVINRVIIGFTSLGSVRTR